MNWFEKARLACASMLLAVAHRLAPGAAKQAVSMTIPLVDGMIEQVAMGRTGGVVTVGWSTDKEGAVISDILRHAALMATADARARLEDVMR